mgnify:CR=1 FL=1
MSDYLTTTRRRGLLFRLDGNRWWIACARSAQEKPAEAPQLRLKLEQEPRMEAAAVVLENNTGAVVSMVGGWDFADPEGNVVGVKQG